MPTERRQTLLAKIIPMFASPENVAVEALAHILSESEATRRALSAILSVGGATVGQIARVRTQATGEDGERPDLVGFDQRGRECVLIEAKFWAGLTANQPLAYLTRLSEKNPSALLFIAPAARIESLWAELCRQVSESTLDITLERLQEKEKLRSAAAGGARRLMLTSWTILLRRMAAEAAADGDSHTECDIGQLRGLAVREDADAFLPLRREELGLEFPRRMLRLRQLIDDVTELGREAGWADTRRAQRNAPGMGLRTILKTWRPGNVVRHRFRGLGCESTYAAVALVLEERGKGQSSARIASATKPSPSRQVEKRFGDSNRLASWR